MFFAGSRNLEYEDFADRGRFVDLDPTGLVQFLCKRGRNGSVIGNTAGEGEFERRGSIQTPVQTAAEIQGAQDQNGFLGQFDYSTLMAQCLATQSRRPRTTTGMAAIIR